MRPAAALLALAALAAGEADPAAWMPADAAVVLRLPDLGRSRERWGASPFARLVATPWGAVSANELRFRLERAAPGAAAALAGLTAAAVALEPPERGTMPRAIAAVAGERDALRVALGALAGAVPPGDGEVAVPGGRLAIAGPVVAWSGGGAVLPRPAHPAAGGDGDLELRVDLARWAPLAGDAAAMLPDRGVLRVAVRLDPVGLRETVATPPGDAAMAKFAAAWERWADPAELAALPPTTLAALTAEGAGLAHQLAAAVPAAFEADLVDLGLPGLAGTLASLDGPCTAWLAEGVPFPSATIALSLPEPLARRWVAAAAAKLNLAPAGDGACAGFVGLLPIAVGWVAATEAGHGRLVLTSDPQGLDAWRKRQPGFADLAPVRESLAAAPKRCLVLGAGRGGASWAALAQLAVPVFAGMGNPHVVALPADLRAAGGRGWLYGVLRPDGGFDLQSGGLLGGPACITALAAGAVPAVLWVQHAQDVERKPAPAAPATEPKVF